MKQHISVVRIWRCLAASETQVQQYLEHFQLTVLFELREIAGFQGADILRRTVEEGIELTVQTRWESLDAIRAFAGDSLETAVVEPAAQAVLLAYDQTVTHHQLELHV